MRKSHDKRLIFLLMVMLCSIGRLSIAQEQTLTLRERIRERFRQRIKERIEKKRQGPLMKKGPPQYDGPIFSIQVDGVNREFIIHIPARIKDQQTVPLVLFFHGGKSFAEGMNKLSGFNESADEHGFIVVYPKGINERWNDGRNSDLATANDVGFVSQLIDHLIAEYPIDQNQIFATGISNGAILTHLLACELSHKIKAIAPVAGGIAGNVAKKCQAAQPISVILFHGTDDPLVPWEGDTGEKRGQIGGKVLSAPKTIEFWKDLNRCRATADVTKLPNKENDGTLVQQYHYPCESEEIQLELYKIINGGHTWPGGWQYAPEKIIGKTSRDINATELIGAFFSQLSK